ncbi:Metallo-dependent phosphatase-like protein [Haematococcus lacustris]
MNLAASAAPLRRQATPQLRCHSATRAVAKLAELSQRGFSSRSLQHFQLAIVGDLHLAPEQMPLFQAARDQLVSAMGAADNPTHDTGARVVQLGDLGHARHASGSVACFEFARDYLDSFQVPYSLVLGNHDLEGEEFETDSDALQGWQRVWRQPYAWTADLGHVKAIGLSTTGFRSNPCSHHEVRIDDAQMTWFEQQLQESGQRPVLVFTHAPPQGCGLKVIEEVHVKNRCAWLNHSDRPARFLALAARYPNIRLWFSGHFHLSHNYKDSISVVGSTAFVQTGVIGTCNRDGHRHSRLLTGNTSGWRLSTLDHDSGKLRADLAGSWDTAAAMQLLTPQQELIASTAGSGWLCSRLDCDVQDRQVGSGEVSSPQAQGRGASTSWFNVGPSTILALQGQLLVEYDIASAAPIGLVCKVPPGCYVRLLGAGRQVLATADWQRDGSQVTAVEVVDTFTGGSSMYPRNEEGAFFVVYQPNKWKLKQAKMMTERQAVKA